MKNKSTSGFVYIWRDRKHKRYYIGSHWGKEDDNYICSSSWMKKSYKKRPQDFKRRILISGINNRLELYEEEQKWFNFIKQEEIGKKYYNLTKIVKLHWTTDPDKLLTVGEKISKANKGRIGPMLGKNHSQETKEKLSIIVSEQMTPEHRQYLSEKSSGWTHTEEAVEKISNSSKNMWNNRTEEERLEISKKISEKTKGRKSPLHQIEHMKTLTGEKSSMWGKIYITDGTKNKGINKNDIIPVGWKLGRTVKKYVTNMSGENNPCYGKRLYNDGKQNKYYKENEVPIGWTLGKMK